MLMFFFRICHHRHLTRDRNYYVLSECRIGMFCLLKSDRPKLLSGEQFNVWWQPWDKSENRQNAHIFNFVSLVRSSAWCYKFNYVSQISLQAKKWVVVMSSTYSWASIGGGGGGDGSGRETSNSNCCLQTW